MHSQVESRVSGCWQISRQVWGYDYDGLSNTIDVHVKYLREKTEAAGEPRLIQTVRGAGYALREL